MEIARFRVVPGIDPDEVPRRMALADAWLRSRPGFLGRTLLGPDAEGRYTDLVWWHSHDDARAAQAAYGGVPELAALKEAIDPASLEISHLPVAHRA